MTLEGHHCNELGMIPFRSDPALCRLMSEGLLVGLSGCCVEDLLRARASEFKSVSARTRAKLEIGDYESLPCKLVASISDWTIPTA